MADIELPALGESVTEGTITQWFKAVGDEVAEDEPLFEVSTDKVDSEFPSPMAGFLTEILVEEGETIEVGTRVAVISETAGEGGSAPVEQPAAETEPVPEPESAPEPEPTPEPVAPAAPASQVPALLSPVVRRLLDDAGVNAASVRGTGVGGRITRADAEQHIRSHSRAAAPTSTPTPTKTSSASRFVPANSPAPARGESVRVPLNKIRQITAEHMVRSLETSAHVYVSTEVDYEVVARVRNANKA
ncbi:MAG: E3 binding domain-containing protein, partial [Acidimicrobiales bacterium]|nr:E3 binding domain-containing protein [Acidimicrobiales bacterium]